MQPYPPLGTIYAASYMRSLGHEVSLHDVMFAHGAEEIRSRIKDEKPDYVVFYDDGFNWLTKMCLTNMRHAAWGMAKIAKTFGATVIFNSSDSTDHALEYLNEGADYVIKGEAEHTLKELVEVLANRSKDLKDVLGIVYKSNGGDIVANDKRPVIRQLDDLPDPAWDLIDIKSYKDRWVNAHGYFSLNMVTTRGCPYKCNWCAKPIYGNRYNNRSVSRVITEIERYISDYGVDHIWYCDDIFGLTPGWVQDFNEQVQKKGLSFRYKIQSRVDLLLTEDTAKCLAESGCDTVWLGAESGSQKILDAMDKGITVDQIYEARPVLKKYGIKCAFFLQFGYLGEEKEDIEATIKMVLDLEPDEIGVSVSYPLPGTKFYEKVKHELTNKSNWTDSDDLDLMFSNNYSNGFYRTLQRYIHKRLEQKKGPRGSVKKIIKWPYHVVSSQYLKAKINQSWKQR